MGGKQEKARDAALSETQCAELSRIAVECAFGSISSRSHPRHLRHRCYEKAQASTEKAATGRIANRRSMIIASAKGGRRRRSADATERSKGASSHETRCWGSYRAVKSQERSAYEGISLPKREHKQEAP